MGLNNRIKAGLIINEAVQRMSMMRNMSVQFLKKQLMYYNEGHHFASFSNNGYYRLYLLEP